MLRERTGFFVCHWLRQCSETPLNSTLAEPVAHVRTASQQFFSRPPGAGRGFTLVELLVVVAIIAILASLFLAGMYTAQESARVERTKATIAKINNIIMQRWDSYRTRRVPIMVGTTPPFVNYYAQSSAFGVYPPPTSKIIAAQRLDALHELMRLELPEQWSDVVYTPYAMAAAPSAACVLSAGQPPNLFASSYSVSATGGAATVNLYGQPPPSVWLAYQRKLLAITTLNQSRGQAPSASGNSAIPGNSNSPTTTNEGAECLYLICTSGLSDEIDDRDLFKPSEVADTDGDGALEFVDAWGTPIIFIRWAPGFLSEMQTGTDPDPFDPLHVYPDTTGVLKYKATAGTTSEAPFALVPLIVSAGSDKAFDIFVNEVLYSNYNNDPYCSTLTTNFPHADGTMMDANNNGIIEYVDNVHNQLMGTR